MLTEEVGGFVYRPTVGTDEPVVRFPRVQGQGIAVSEHFSTLLARKHDCTVRLPDVLVEVRTTDERLVADGARQFDGRTTLADVARLQLNVFEHLAALGALQIGMGRASVAQQRIASFERCRTGLTLKPTRFVVCPNVTTQIGRRREAFLAHPAAIRLVLINLSAGGFTG